MDHVRQLADDDVERNRRHVPEVDPGSAQPDPAAPGSEARHEVLPEHPNSVPQLRSHHLGNG